MTVEIVQANDKKQVEQFLRLPWRLYEGMANWVPNPLFLQREVLSEKQNPFFEHGEAQLFLAMRDGQPVGRISAQIDHRHLEHYNEKTGFFGFFEAIDDAEVSRALLDAAEGWLAARGMDRIRGPLSFSQDEEAGLMIEGFDEPAMISMPQGQPYYPPMIENDGYEKAMDLLAYRWDIHEPPERMMQAIDRTRAVPGLKLRRVNMRHLKQDVDVMLDIYQQAWSSNWGYVPVTKRAGNKLASDLRLIADPRILLIAEIDGEAAGFIIALPNLYEATRDFNGFIDPWKALKLIWRLKVRGVQQGRIFVFGVKPKFRGRELVGLPFLLLHELYKAAQTRRYTWCEQSWVLENNSRLNALMPYWNAYVYKRFRIYEKALEPAAGPA